jgi:flagella basal body P-ring formation protein FlgA
MLVLLLTSGMAAPSAEATALVPEDGSKVLASRLAEAALAFAEAEAAKLPGSYKILLVQPPVAPRILHGDPRIEVSHLSKKEPTGRFFVALKVTVEGRLAGYVRVDLDGTWTGNLLKAKEDLVRKAIPEPSQLDSTPFEGLPPPGALTAFPEGYRLRQAVQAGRFITRGGLELVPMVRAGERVRLTATFQGLSIAMEGVARNSAARGERVRVELSGTRKLVQGTASGEGEVRLAGFEASK